MIIQTRNAIKSNAKINCMSNKTKQYFLITTTLKTGPHGMKLNAIKDLSVSSPSLIGFEVE